MLWMMYRNAQQDKTRLTTRNFTEFESFLEDFVGHRLEKYDRLGVRVFENLWNPRLCHKDYLIYLAWALKMSVWDDNWSEEYKREIIERWIAIRKVQGTFESLRLAYDAIGIEPIIKEWWEADGPTFDGEEAPYYFDIALTRKNSTEPITENELKYLYRITDELKPLRSRYGIRIVIKSNHEVGQASFVRLTTFVTGTVVLEEPASGGE